MMHKVQSKNLKCCRNVDVTRRTESPKGLCIRGEVRKGLGSSTLQSVRRLREAGLAAGAGRDLPLPTPFKSTILTKSKKSTRETMGGHR